MALSGLSNAHADAFYDAIAMEAARRPPAEADRWLGAHGLAGRALRERIRDDELRRLVEVRARAATARSLFWVDSFQRVVDALSGIDVCALKGIALLETAYGDDPGARELTDLDLLVGEGDLEEAVSRLGTNLQLVEPGPARSLARWHHERHLQRGQLAVDLHRRLGTTVLERSSWPVVSPIEKRLHERDVHVLGPEIDLVHLVVHFAVHGPFTRLAWVEDIVRLPHPPRDAQSSLAVHARRLGGGRAFSAGVGALRSLVGEDFLAGLPAARRSLGQLLCERVLWRSVWKEPLVVRPPRRGRLSLARLLLADSLRQAWHSLVARFQGPSPQEPSGLPSSSPAAGRGHQKGDRSNPTERRDLDQEN